MALKRIKSAVRLEMSISGDMILNELVAEFSEEFDRRVAAGESYELTGYDERIREAVAKRAPLALISRDDV